MAVGAAVVLLVQGEEDDVGNDEGGKESVWR